MNGISYRSLGIGFVAFGIFFIVLGVVAYFFIKSQHSKFFEKAIKTTAVIKEIEAGDETHTVYVTFSMENGEEVTTKIYEYSASMRIGNFIDVYYHPDNLRQIKASTFNQSWVVLIIFGGIGSIFFIIGCRFLKIASTTRLL